MINSIIKSKWIWLSLTVSLVILVVMSFYGIYYVYNSNTYWKRQFIIADGQYLVKFKTEKIVLTEDMKKWLDSHDIRQKRYYRAVIKGYGSHI